MTSPKLSISKGGKMYKQHQQHLTTEEREHINVLNKLLRDYRKQSVTPQKSGRRSPNKHLRAT